MVESGIPPAGAAVAPMGWPRLSTRPQVSWQTDGVGSRFRAKIQPYGQRFGRKRLPTPSAKKYVAGCLLLRKSTSTWKQQAGLGFPILPFVMLFSLATGAVCGFAEAPYEGKETGEPALLPALFARFQSGDIALGDACFCSYFLIALLAQSGDRRCW